MRRLLTLLLIAVFGGATLVGCEDSPTSVDDFDIQPAVTLTTSNLTMVEGETATFQVRYQGLDVAPEATAPAGFAVEVVGEEGTPQSGSRTFRVGYDDEVPALGSVAETVTVTVTGGGREITRTVNVAVNSVITASETYQNRFAVVEDYEDANRSVTTSGGAVTEQVTDVVPPNSNGLNALRVQAPGTVTIERWTNAPGQTVFTFLAKPDPTTDFDLTLTFTEMDGGVEETHEVTLPIESGDVWRRYTIAGERVFDGFDPVAERSGGNGPLTSISMATDANVQFYVDELAFGTNDGPTIEVHDFEAPSFAYVCAPVLEDTETVPDMSDGVTARSISYTEGGNCFGYNTQADGAAALFLEAGNDAHVEMIVGEVTRAFDLYVFVETDGGAYTYDTGVVVPVEEGEDFRLLSVPLADLGAGVDALGRPAGIRNIGFEVRRPDSDTTTEEIAFVLDGVKLIGH